MSKTGQEPRLTTKKPTRHGYHKCGRCNQYLYVHGPTQTKIGNCFCYGGWAADLNSDRAAANERKEAKR